MKKSLLRPHLTYVVLIITAERSKYVKFSPLWKITLWSTLLYKEAVDQVKITSFKGVNILKNSTVISLELNFLDFCIFSKTILEKLKISCHPFGPIDLVVLQSIRGIQTCITTQRLSLKKRREDYQIESYYYSCYHLTNLCKENIFPDNQFLSITLNIAWSLVVKY